MAHTIDTTARTVSVPDSVEVVDKKRYLLEVCDEVLYSSRFSTVSDIKRMIADKVLDDVDVKFYWDLAIGLTPVEVGDELLPMVIDLFLTICGKIQTIKQKGYTKIKSIEKKKLF